MQLRVVLAANSEATRAALDLLQAGIEVAAVVDLRAEGEPAAGGQRLEQAGIRVRAGRLVYEAIGSSAGRVRGRGVSAGASGEAQRGAPRDHRLRRDS